MSSVKERPILFSGAMVRALLDGSKTQTRRANGLLGINEAADQWARQWVPNTGRWHWLFQRAGYEDVYLRCPYGVEGERLWVRESHAFLGERLLKSEGQPGYLYRADSNEFDGAGIKWKPSIHMPRVASRLLLEITAVRVERLQDISEADAVAEGIEAHPSLNGLYKLYGSESSFGTKESSYDYCEWGRAVSSYASLWNQINGPHAYAANPWVWVVEFKVIAGGKEVASV